MRILTTIALFLCLIFSKSVLAQSSVLENEIEQLASLLIEETPRSEKDSINKALTTLLETTLNNAETFSYPFNDVKSLSILTSPDSSFRIYNWEVSYLDGTNRYECFVQQKAKNKLRLVHLKPLDSTFTTEQLIHMRLNEKRWLGALYYKIIPVKTKFTTYYTLLGWDGNDLLTNKKYIEILWFDKAGNLNFGSGLFRDNRSVQSRVIFEYGGQNAMTLNYEEELNRISYNHLAPPSSNLKGIYEYYGADITFDGYDWNGKYWNSIQEIIPAWADPKGRTSAKVTNKKFSENSAANPAEAKKILKESEKQLKKEDERLKKESDELK